MKIIKSGEFVEYKLDEQIKKYLQFYEPIVFNEDANSHVLRVRNSKNGLHSRVMMEEVRDDKWCNFIKSSKASYLGIGSANPKEDLIYIVTFNIPEEKIAYKAIYPVVLTSEIDSYPNGRDYGNKPLKILFRSERTKWKTLKEPSQELLDKCLREKEKLHEYIWPLDGEIYMGKRLSR